MKTKIFILLLFIPIIVFSQNSQKVSVGDKMFNIVGNDENGLSIDVSDYLGKYILLNFTATNCGPCWKTYNIMNEMQSKYSDDLKVISFHLDNDLKKWNSIAKSMDINFKCTSIWESKNKTEILKTYDVDGFPYFYLIDKDGIIIKKWFGNKRNKIVKVLNKHIK
ncbi:MAG: TlpA family protein disulfide reductase [Psychroflexus halocasei]|uniref:TlpA family protein disulfide reductase n=1 Tax=Psychroflexus sp. S27 TaxID=1982757 RepID=UPI000C29EC40|nr:TlpA disulfide reductase family protein [Psychroflexus sp. S27]PJX26943.1 hypothetical protein CAP47_01980 [Psychroflexus sp. S27]